MILKTLGRAVVPEHPTLAFIPETNKNRPVCSFIPKQKNKKIAVNSRRCNLKFGSSLYLLFHLHLLQYEISEATYNPWKSCTLGYLRRGVNKVSGACISQCKYRKNLLLPLN